MQNMGVGSGGQEGAVPPWIFIHGTYIVDRGLIVLFFGLYLLFFGLFCYFSVFFPSSPPGKFSADALDAELIEIADTDKPFLHFA